MPLSHHILPSFAGGEVCPSLHARVDLAKYHTGLKTARNVNILPQGGVRNRPGTYYVAAAKDSTHAVRLIPFVYSDGQAYMLEFGQYYLRVFKNGAIVPITNNYTIFNPAESYLVGEYVKTRFVKKAHYGGGYLYFDFPESVYPFVQAVISSDLYTGHNTDTLEFVANQESSYGVVILAKTTSSKNSAALIQALLRSEYAAWDGGGTITVTEDAAWLAQRPTSGFSYAMGAGIETSLSNKISRCVIVVSGNNFPGTSTSWGDSTLEVITPYLGTELFDIKVTQSADYLFIFHPDHAPQQLIRTTEDSWGMTPFPFKNGPFMLSNVSPSKTLTSDVTTTGYTVDHTISSVIARDINSVSFNSVILRKATAHGLKTGDKVKVSLLDGALASALNGNVYSIDVERTPNNANDILLCYENTNTMIEVPTFSTYTPGAGKYSSYGLATITANFPVFFTGHEGALFQLTETIPAQSVSQALTTTVASAAMKCGNTWRIITSGGWTGTLRVYASTDGGVTYNLLRNLTSDGNDNYDTSGDTGTSQCLVRVTATFTGTCNINLYGDTFDWVAIIQIVEVTNSTTATALILYDAGIGAGIASTNPTYQWAEGSWSDYRGWPTVATFYQDRLVAASTISEPQTRWFSQTADYVNFGISVPIVDSDSISDLLPSRTVNIVKNMIALTGLVTLTSDSDFSTEPGNSGILAPNSISTNCQGHRGSSDITPAVVGNELIIALPMGSAIRNLIYQFSVQGYMGDNISVVSQHLFTGYSIIEMAYQQEPDSLVWAVRSDGVLLCLTYLREQEVIAWTRHDTDGLFESVAVIPNTTLGINEVWFVVNRGGTRFIERLAKRDMGTDVKNYVMLDCATTTTSSGTTVSGLTYLNGKVVNVLADGDVVTGLTVANGAITLPRAATIVHVGLPYVSDVETLRIEQADQKGTSQGRRVVIPEVTIRFMDSRGGWLKAVSQDISAPAATGVVGFDENVERDASDLASAPMPLRTRDYRMTLNGGYDFGAGLFFRQVDPLPVTILCFVPKLEVSDS